MPRKTLGFLILALVVVAGIVFVERRLRDPDGADAWSEVDSTTYQVVLGGESPSRPAEDDARPAPPPPGGPGTAGTHRTPSPPPTGPTPPRRPPNQFRYVMKKGDVLGAVVLAHLGTASPRAVERVARDSGLTDPNRVAAGQELILTVDVWEALEATGDESIHDLANRAYGAPGRTEALRLANPHLPPVDDALVPAGTPIWVAR